MDRRFAVGFEDRLTNKGQRNDCLEARRHAVCLVSCACVLGDGRHMRRSVSAQLFYDKSLERVSAEG
jgi:hypothetical protein